MLIHGWPLSGESWSERVPALSQAGYRVVSYDRRGFGRSDKPAHGYSYDTLAEDLHTLLEELDLREVTLVGFSMGGGEVARYCATYGSERLHSVVLASAVTPYMLHTGDNPDGPLSKTKAAKLSADLTKSEDSFYDQFTTEFFSALSPPMTDQHGTPMVSEQQRQQAITLCKQANKKSALACLTAFGTTDFRDDLTKVTVPVLVVHGEADGTVPFEGSGRRTHQAIPQSELVVIPGGPHGVNVSHANEFNTAWCLPNMACAYMHDLVRPGSRTGIRSAVRHPTATN